MSYFSNLEPLKCQKCQWQPGNSTCGLMPDLATHSGTDCGESQGVTLTPSIYCGVVLRLIQAKESVQARLWQDMSWAVKRRRANRKLFCFAFLEGSFQGLVPLEIPRAWCHQLLQVCLKELCSQVGCGWWGYVGQGGLLMPRAFPQAGERKPRPLPFAPPVFSWRT